MRELLREVTELPKEFFSVIDNAVMSSKFWTKTNDDEDSTNPGKTPAASALEKAIQQAMKDVGLDMDVQLYRQQKVKQMLATAKDKVKNSKLKEIYKKYFIIVI